MGRSKREDRWLEDFSIVLRPDAIRSMRRRTEFDVFTGSKFLAVCGLPLSQRWLEQWAGCLPAPSC